MIPSSAPPSGWWKPSPAAPIHWQWQIGTPFSYPGHVIPNVTVYDIDAFDTPKSVVDSLHALGCIVIAYFSFGTWEDWRPDASLFPASVKGNNNGWPGEKWLDIRSETVKAIMADRLDMAVANGFDAVEPDNIDGYSNNSGFPLTASNQITYNRWIAQQCHARGLSVGLKNDVDQMSQLVGDFDWVLNEECNQYSECGNLSVFVNAGKAVFQCEYSGSYCSAMNAAHFNSMRRNLDLTASGVRVPCIPDTQNHW
jgi:hypothetical protein